MEAKAKAEEEAAGMAGAFGGAGRYTGVISDDIPRALAKKQASAEELI